MEKVKKSINKILDILDDAEENLNAAYNNMATFYTSLKEKDISLAYFYMIELKKGVDVALEKLDVAVDNYEMNIIKILEEEENARKK